MEFDFGSGDRPAGPGRRTYVRSASGWDYRAADGETYSVSAVNALARRIIEGSIPPLWVEGEVSGWKRHGPTGHCYFTLKDATAQMRAVMFRLDAQHLPTDPEEGMEVRVLGTLTLYERRGEYQFVARELEARGAGGLWKLAFEKLRLRLESEGLLDPARKRALPRYPRVVGVVTSPVGAAFQDIVHVIRARAPWTRILFSPARVQGEGASRDLARALDMLGRHGQADVVIVGRGGGSLEDLWAFNEEPLARAIAACPVPVISAVGHEVDTTIADLVADVRAPTPSAAAERAVPDSSAVGRQLSNQRARLAAALGRSVVRRRRALEEHRAWLADAARQDLLRRRERVSALAARLDALSPLAALSRGFAVPLDEEGSILRRRADFHPATRVRLRVVDGEVPLRVDAEGGRSEEG
jgi:exodeoxyribonuclease VII large subunit